MARSGYLGKISAVVAVNTGGVKPSLNTAKQDIQSWGRTVQSQFNSTTGSAKKAIESIFTPLQRLQAAVNAANRNPLQLNVPNVRSFLDLAKATERIGKPLGDAQKQLSSFSREVQAELLPAFQSAQKQATQLFDTISSGARIADRDFANTESRINRVIAAVKRANEASQAVRGLADGQELRFQNPEFLRTTSRAAALQQQAAALSPDDIAGRGIGGLVAQQRQAAEEAERLRSAIERITITRRGDAQEAQRAYTQQLSLLDRINDAIQEQVTLSQQAATARESAAARRSAFDTLELDRRAGATARRNAASFEDATAGLLTRQPSRAELFGRQSPAEAMDRELARTAAMRQQFLELPADVQQSLEQERALLNSIATAARDGAAGAETLAAANDRMAQSIANANSQLEQQAEAARRQAVAAANSRLAVLQDESTPIRDPEVVEAERQDAQRRAEVASRRLVVDDPVGRANAAIGLDIASPQRAIGLLGGSISSVKSQIESLPAAMRAQFVPAIRDAENEYRRLFTTAGTTTEEIDRAAENLQNLQQGLTRAANAATQFGGTFAQFRDNADARVAAAGLEYLRTTLSRATGDTTRAAAALDALSAAQQRAANTPNGFRDNAAELQRLTNEAIEAASAVAGIGISQRGIRQGLARTGDVARGAFGNAGLAIQQAAFAIDDFFSVTGGLDQRVRAAGNNLSQLGFILGGTEGLILGISASIGSQLIVALVNWYNQGRTTEDQVKALNDALSRQKSLVDDLRKAFESLGDSIAGRAFSEPAKRARDFQRELEEVAKKQKEAREARVTDLSAGVQRERGNQNRIQRELEKETDAGRRVTLQRELQESQRREQVAAASAVADANTLRGEGQVRQRIENAIYAALTLGIPNNQNTDAQREEARAAARTAPNAGNTPEDILNQRRAVEAQIESLRGRIRLGNINPASANEGIRRLQQLLEQLELPLQEAIDGLSNQILRSSFAASSAIESAQNDVADAIRRGVQGAAEFGIVLDGLAKELDQAQANLNDAQKIRDPAAREAAVRAAQDKVDAVRGRQDEVDRRSREARLGRTFGGERTTRALAAMQGNERFANEFGGRQAYLARIIDNEVAAREAVNRAIEGGNQAEIDAADAALKAAQEASETAAGFAEAAVSLEDAVGRLRKLASSALSQSEGIADNAQRRLTENPTAENRRRRDEAELQLIADRERLAKANNALDRQRSAVSRQPNVEDPENGGDAKLRAINNQLESITQERKRLEEEAKKNGTFVSTQDAQDLADREAELIAERERTMFELTEAERRQIDAINEEIAARQRMIDFENEVRDRRKPVGNDIRGLDLLERPGEKAARETRQQVADIRAATAGEVALAIKEGRFGDIAGIQQRGRDAEQRAVSEQMRNTAPAIFALADSVQNALLQGPSRAALQASDVSTVEGSRELSRLLRGDDAARNQDLVQLQKEANRLLDLIANNPANVAN